MSESAMDNMDLQQLATFERSEQLNRDEWVNITWNKVPNIDCHFAKIIFVRPASEQGAVNEIAEIILCQNGDSASKNNEILEYLQNHLKRKIFKAAIISAQNLQHTGLQNVLRGVMFCPNNSYTFL